MAVSAIPPGAYYGGMSTLFSHAETVPEDLRAHMARRRLTQTEIASALGKSNNWLSRRLRGTYAITLDDLDRIAAACGLVVTITIGEPKGRMR